MVGESEVQATVSYNTEFQASLGNWGRVYGVLNSSSTTICPDSGDADL